MNEHINTLLSDWTAAELAGDSQKLATLLTDDFSGVGPMGFVLPRSAWTGRHHRGLAYEHFGLEEIQIRHYGDVAVVAAGNVARGTYQGQPLPEALQATLVIASSSASWRLAAIHMSFIAGTQGSPPLPVPAGLAERSARTPMNGEGR
jgi:ketosteroid isomerase-like protein